MMVVGFGVTKVQMMFRPELEAVPVRVQAGPAPNGPQPLDPRVSVPGFPLNETVPAVVLPILPSVGIGVAPAQPV